MRSVYTDGMITTIFFDLDDTILDFKACEKQALSKALDTFAFVYTDEDISDYSRINDMTWKKFERGEISRDRLKIERFEVFLSRFDKMVDASLFADKYMEKLSETSAMIDGARETLEILSEKYRLYAVTNGYERTQRGRIAASGVGKYFRDVFISETVGVAKPKKEYFDYCASHVPNFVLSETVLVGDSPTSDIAGGRAYGLYTIRFNPFGLPSEEVEAHADVSSLRELPTLLSRL